jgi:hypothetical protein
MSDALPISPGMVIAFTPPCAEALDPKPVYQLRPMGWRDRARFNADIAAEGLLPVQQSEYYEAARAALGEAEIDDDVRAPLLAVIDAHEAARAAEDPVPPQIGARWVEIIHMVGLPASPMARLLARQIHWQHAVPVLLLKRVLVGWENGPGEFRASNGIASDATIDLIPEDQLQALQVKAGALTTVGKDQEKNFGSRPGSRSSRKSSRTAGTSRAASTGSSKARSTKKTRG